MPMSSILKLLSAGTFLVLTVGCVTPHKNITDLAPGSLQKGKTVTLIYALDCADRTDWTGRCAENSDTKSGGDFITDPINVSNAAKSIGRHEELGVAAAQLDVASVMQTSMEKHFNPLFESSGLVVRTGTANFRAWTLPQRNKPMFVKFGAYHRDPMANDEARTGSGLSLNPDYESIMKDLETDYLLAIEILRYGFVRKYTPGISVALEPPTAAAAIRASLYVEGVKEPIYDNIISRRGVPEFEWKSPPDFVELMTLPPMVLDAVIEDAASEFFGNS